MFNNKSRYCLIINWRRNYYAIVIVNRKRFINIWINIIQLRLWRQWRQCTTNWKKKSTHTRGGAQSRRIRQATTISKTALNDWSTWESAPFIPSIPTFAEKSGAIINLPQNSQATTTPKTVLNDLSTWESALFIPCMVGMALSSQKIPVQSSISSKTVKENVEIFLTNELVEYLVQQTSLYARQFLSKITPSSKSRVNEWKPVTNDDVRHYIALTILMGINSVTSRSKWLEHKHSSLQPCLQCCYEQEQISNNIKVSIFCN